MVTTFYLAGSSAHEYRTNDLSFVRDKLVANGLRCGHDWMSDGKVTGHHKRVACAEDNAHGASDADVFILCLGRGDDDDMADAHVAYGVALSRKMLFASNRIILWVSDEDSRTRLGARVSYSYPDVEVCDGGPMQLVTLVVEGRMREE